MPWTSFGLEGCGRWYKLASIYNYVQISEVRGFYSLKPHNLFGLKLGYKFALILYTACFIVTDGIFLKVDLFFVLTHHAGLEVKGIAG